MCMTAFLKCPCDTGRAVHFTLALPSSVMRYLINAPNQPPVIYSFRAHLLCLLTLKPSDCKI